MKFLVFFFLVLGCSLAVPVDDRSAAIKTQEFTSDSEGNFQYNYETENGIQARALGAPKQVGNPPETAETIEGQFQWITPDGKTVVVQYTADENGYYPKVQTGH